MKQPDSEHHVRDMLTYARKAAGFVQGKNRQDLEHDELLQLGLMRAVEVIGEAANRTTLPYQQQHAAIPWRQIIGARNRLIHGYDRVDLDVLWDIVTADLPTLIAQLQAILDRQMGTQG